MSGGYKKIFLLILSMGCVFPSYAQFIDNDIPLDWETDAPASLAIAPKSEPKKKNEPNIGRNASPLKELVVTPDPLPKVAINLDDKVPEPISLQPTLPPNTRQEEIYIPPTEKTDTIPPPPSNFANLHDVRQFDIEGFYLGMLPKAVLQLAQQKRYFITKIKKKLPLFQTSHYESLCRQSGIHAPEMIRACIRQYAIRNKQDYVEEIVLTRKATKESFHFTFTSPATGNEAYQIIYHTKGDNSLNFMPSNLSKKLSRKEAFFNAVFNMYGYPDDNKELIWGAKEDAYMQVSMSGSAYDATIRMVDTQLSNEDYFAASDWKAEQAPLYHFGFAE